MNPPMDGVFRDWLKTQNAGMAVVQPFYPAAQFYDGFDVIHRLEDMSGAFDAAVVFFPKNKVEGHYALSMALDRLEIGGTLITAAANKEGGNRLKKCMSAMAMGDVFDVSKDKAKAVRGVKRHESAAPESWISDGAAGAVPAHDFMTQAGVYGWNKVDRGSALLIENLPDILKGRGADFGCGYGLLARYVLEHNERVSMLYLLDADARSVALAAENLAGFSERIEPRLCDLTRPQERLNNLDFIVMNPPFHEGKKTDVAIGQGFIKTASASLRPRGLLYVVANAHLPYETLLKDEFKTVEKLHEGGGFKVFKAQKS